MKIPREFADGKTDMAPLLWELMRRGEFEGIEGCAPTLHLREVVALSIIQGVPLTLTLHPGDAWPEIPQQKAQA